MLIIYYSSIEPLIAPPEAGSGSGTYCDVPDDSDAPLDAEELLSVFDEPSLPDELFVELFVEVLVELLDELFDELFDSDVPPELELEEVLLSDDELEELSLLVDVSDELEFDDEPELLLSSSFSPSSEVSDFADSPIVDVSTFELHLFFGCVPSMKYAVRELHPLFANFPVSRQIFSSTTVFGAVISFDESVE